MREQVITGSFLQANSEITGAFMG